MRRLTRKNSTRLPVKTLIRSILLKRLILSVSHMRRRINTLVLMLPSSNHVIHALHVLLSLLGDGLVVSPRLEGLGVVRVGVEGFVCCVEDFSSEGVAGSADALKAGLDIFDEF
ncbi:hypothetical protein HG530_013844 [Fusarium avenaceum]|nr:hypothetical protein HG530_013844 [Fusarium avenaceum]